MKRRSFEEALPEGYVSRLTVDCQDKKLGILMNLAALAIMAVLCVVFWRLIQPWDAFLAAPLTSLLKTAVFMVAVSAYIVLHELLHGAAYKLLTGRKLTFGLTWSAAYCGVPDIFVYRSAALVALLAPLCGVHRRFSAGGAADRRSGEPVYGRLSAGHPLGWMRRRFI